MNIELSDELKEKAEQVKKYIEVHNRLSNEHLEIRDKMKLLHDKRTELEKQLKELESKGPNVELFEKEIATYVLDSIND